MTCDRVQVLRHGWLLLFLVFPSNSRLCEEDLKRLQHLGIKTSYQGAKFRSWSWIEVYLKPLLVFQL